MLELHEWKHSRAVLRGGGGGEVTSLPDPLVRGSIPPNVGRGARGVGRENSGGHCGPTSFSTVDREAEGSLMSQRRYVGEIGVKCQEKGVKWRLLKE